MRYENHSAQPDLVAVVQHAVDLCWREVHIGRLRIVEVCFTAALDDGHVPVHDHVFRMSYLHDARAASSVIVMRMADEQNFYVAEFEPKLLDTLLNLRRRGREIAVDEDVSLRRGDQERREVPAAHVIHVADHAIGTELCRPVRIGLRAGDAGQSKETYE